MNDGVSNEQRLIIWHISDGRRGHDSQCLGLVQALQQLRPCEYFKIPFTPLPGLILPYLAGRFPAGGGLPDPDLIIGAGHHTHLSLLCAKRARRGRAIVLMRPSLPASWFDACLVPNHDRQPASASVIQTNGALTRIFPTDRHDPGRGLVLIGGPSDHHSWDHDNLLRQINRVVGNSGLQWLITDSPRTPENTSEALTALQSATVRYATCKGLGPSWLPGQLGRAGVIWITEDSVSMIYEALTSGAMVGLLEVPRKRDSRVTRIADELSNQSMVTLFRDWCAGKALSSPSYALNESGRCARLLLEKFFL